MSVLYIQETTVSEKLRLHTALHALFQVVLSLFDASRSRYA